MSIRTLTGENYFSMVRSGASTLASNRKSVNDLNVFPIPDGDTGDNMFMTIDSGCSSAVSVSDRALSEVASSISSGMLFGARGNSGVILSRIFAGISKGLEGLSEADVEQWKKAMHCGVDESYGAVATPVEGTILTVFRMAVQVADNCDSGDFESYFEMLCTEMAAALERTPDQLDVLKKAGVVDSGGAGLVYIFEGMKAALSGKTVEYAGTSSGASATKIDLSAFTEDSELEFGYCTEFLLRLQTSKVDLGSFDETVIRDYLEVAGDSLVFFRDGSIIKVHVHTRRPGEILNKCQEWGEYLTIKVENMTLQHHENRMDEKFGKGPRKGTATVVVASGNGVVRTFRDMGADEVIEGGQTMNPSAESFLRAFEKVNADRIFVFPNNSNIILTAQQAASLFKGSEIFVIPSKSIGAGYAAFGSIDFSEEDSKQILSQADEAIESVVTGMISRAVRDTAEVSKNDYIGFVSSEILCGSTDRNTAALELCDKLEAGNYDVILIFRGADTPADDAEELRTALESRYRRSEVIMTDGGQGVYDYIFVLE